MECEFNKYGCTVRIANSDHLQAHLTHYMPTHLRLLSSALEAEVEKNKALGARVAALERVGVDSTSNSNSNSNSNSELEGRWRMFQVQMETRFAALLDDTRSYTRSGTVPAPLSSSSGERPGSRSSLDLSSPPIERIERGGNRSSMDLSSPPVERPASRTGSDSTTSSRGESGTAKSPPTSSYKPPARSAEAPSSSMRPSSHSRSISSVGVKDMDIKEKKSHVLAHSATAFVADKHKSDPGYDAARSLTLEDIEGFEKGILWGYDATTKEWCRGTISFRMDKTAFAEGALRGAYKVTARESLTDASDSPPEASVMGDKKIKKDTLPAAFGSLGEKYVAKISKNKVAIDRYFEDVKMQVICLQLGQKFNNFKPPKPVQFLPAWVLEMPSRHPVVYCGLEPYVEGEFVKLSNNYGAVLSDRNTPAALSHFSWEATDHTYLVIDIQGVKDFYTDPQIHTKDGKGFGLGNLGMNGIDRFLKTHKCNAICQMLNLPMINQIDTKKKVTMKGTMKVPYIEDQLGASHTPKWDTAYDSPSGDFQCVQTLTNHEDRVVSLCVTGKYFIAGCANGDLRIYNLPALTVHMNLNAHRKCVNSMVANETHLYTCSDDHSIKAWNLGKFDSAAQLRDHVGEVNGLALTDKALGYLVSASFDKNLKVWSTRTFKFVNNLEGHTKAIKTVAISGSILFSGSNDGCIMVWSLQYMSCLFTIQAHDGWVKTLAVKDKSLYSGAFDYLVKEWDILTFNLQHTMTAHNDDVMAVLATDKFLVTASNDRSIVLWDYKTKKCVASLKGHRSGVQSLATDGTCLFSGSDDYNVKVWKFVQH